MNCYLGEMTHVQRPALEEMPAFYHGYVQRLNGSDLFEVMRASTSQATRTFAAVGEERSLFRYAETKWSVREVVQHLTDCERILSYRALCFSRGEKCALPGFDEDAYVAHSDADRRSWSSLISEWHHVRSGTMDLFDSFTPEMLRISGTANGGLVTVRALGWIVAGHTEQHLHIITERYV